MKRIVFTLVFCFTFIAAGYSQFSMGASIGICNFYPVVQPDANVLTIDIANENRSIRFSASVGLLYSFIEEVVFESDLESANDNFDTSTFLLTPTIRSSFLLPVLIGKTSNSLLLGGGVSFYQQLTTDSSVLENFAFNLFSQIGAELNFERIKLSISIMPGLAAFYNGILTNIFKGETGTSIIVSVLLGNK